MNLKGKLVTNLSLSGNASIPTKVNTGGASTWNEITGKPFSTVDTENGLAIYDNILMIDTLDKIATIDYVDQEIANVESEIPSLDGYATEQYVDDAVSSAQSDWNEDDSNRLDYIKNKPAIRAGSGKDSIVEGSITNQATSLNSHAEGSNTKASGFYSHAEGATTEANGWYSHAEGSGTIASAQSQHVQGRWNIADTNQLYADIVGNGALNARSNAEATDWNGNKYVAGDVYTQVTNWATTPTLGANKLASENYVDTAISNIPDPDWSDIQNKPTFATVATSGDYDDLDNKPTIPVVPTNVSAFNNDAGYITSSALSGYATETYVNGATTAVANSIPTPDNTTIVSNNGVWSAVGGGSEPDEKSIITNAQDKLEEAVPIYTEVVSHDVGGVGLNISNYRAGTSDGDFYVDTKETQLTFVADAANSNQYYNVVLFGTNGWVSAKWRNVTNVTYNCVIDDASSYFSSKIGSSIQCYYRYQQDTALFPNGNHYGVKFHIYDTSVLPPWSQWTSFLIYPTEDGIAAGDTLETQCETIGLTWAQGVWNEQIIHKLPNEYLNLKSDEVLYSGYYPMLYNDASGNIRAKRLGAGSNISLGTINLADGTQGYQFSCTLKESPIGGFVSGEKGSVNLYISNYEDISGGNPFKKRYYTSQTNWNSFFSSAGSDKDLVLTLRYCTSSSYYNNGPKITGYFHLGATNTDNPTLEGFEEIIDRVYIDTTNTTKYFCVELKDGYNIGFSQNFTMGRPPAYYPKQNVNALFLPLDKETIITDSNGNIKTAIPAPPTTDGTYTLQVTVSNGEPTYSWI